MMLEVVFKDGRSETFHNVESFNVTETIKLSQEMSGGCMLPYGRLHGMSQTPAEGKLFEVNPLKIDRSLFAKTRQDSQQEWVRQIIQEAFVEVNRHPEQYVSPFYTLIPEKTWEGPQKLEAFNKCANELGGRIATWVEQAMEWAQRISNGESWEVICNAPDTEKWHRLTLWKHGCYGIVGRAHNLAIDTPASVVRCYRCCDSDDNFVHIVPLVVIKKRKMVHF